MPAPAPAVPNPRITNYRDLVVWQRAMELCEGAYRLCRRLPRAETFGIGDQIRRASVSVASNIAEGHNRSHTGDYIHHLSIARGSLAELETQLAIAVRVDYFTEREVSQSRELCITIGRMLTGLIRRLQQKQELASRRARRRPAVP